VADYRAEAVPEEGAAPAFELPSLNGQGTVSLASYRGKIVVLNFWASWCAPCWQEAPGLQAVWERYRSRGVQFLGVNERDDHASAGSFVEENGLTFPSASDPSGELAGSYGIIAMPTTFVIDSTGQLAYRLIGYADERALRAILDEMLGAAP